MAKEIAQPTDEQIRTRAYFLWESEGRPQNRDWEYWLKAKEELMISTAPEAPAKTSTKKVAAEPAATPRRKASSRTAVYA